MATFPIEPPVEPMLAKLSEAIPEGEVWLYEPKWDGFRALVFRGGPGEVYIQSRDLKPLDRYFPELHEQFLATLPDGCVIDGEIVIATAGGLSGCEAGQGGARVVCRIRSARRGRHERDGPPATRSASGARVDCTVFGAADPSDAVDTRRRRRP